MKRILFVCHGNICRSPMAEFVMKDLVKKAGLEDDFEIASAATSREEIGNPVHYGTKRILAGANISCAGKTARQMTKSDYAYYDCLIGMDQRNLGNMIRIAGGDPEEKIKLLLEYASIHKDIADPWYTGNFELTYEEVLLGCKALLKQLIKE